MKVSIIVWQDMNYFVENSFWKKSYRKKSFWKIRVAKLMLKIMFCIYLLTILDWLSILLMNEPLLINEPCKLLQNLCEIRGHWTVFIPSSCPRSYWMPPYAFISRHLGNSCLKIEKLEWIAIAVTRKTTVQYHSTAC